MGNESSARSIAAITVDKVPDTLYIKTKFRGKYENIDMNSAYNVRIDYFAHEKTVKSVLYTFLPLNPRRHAPVPWGIQQSPEIIRNAPNLLTGRELLTIKADAPPYWDGRIIITVDLHSTGEGTEVEVSFSSPE
jgi:hypothetical protein